MSDTNNYPAPTCLNCHQPIVHGTPRAYYVGRGYVHVPRCMAPRDRRQREADNATVAGRVAELAADVEVMVQRARWSLEVNEAHYLHDYSVGIEGNDDDDGIYVSGDHRPPGTFALGIQPWLSVC